MDNEFHHCKYKISKWTHIIKHEEENIFFNSMNLEILKGDGEVKDFLTEFQKPITVQDVLTRFEQQDALHVVDSFIRYGFLVPEGLDENLQLSQIKNKIKLERSPQEFSRRVNTARVVLTENCNIRCDYCFVTNTTKDLKDNEKASILRGLDQLIEINKNSDLHIHFFGGEPTIKFELIKEIVQYLKSKLIQGILSETRFSITTNGTLIYPGMAQYFFENNFDISVSIDGWGDLNDRHRTFIDGKGSFEAVVRGIKLLKQYRNRIGALLTITNDNLEQLPEICEYIIKNLRLFSISINTPQPNQNGWGINGKRLAQKIMQSKEICERSGAKLNSTGDSIFYALGSKKPQILPCVSDKTCMIALSPDNEISFCKVNWTEDECRQPIKIKPLVSEKLVNWKLSDPYESSECNGCIAMNTCGGPCPLEKVYLKRTGYLDNEGHCAFYKHFTKEAVLQLSSGIEN